MSGPKISIYQLPEAQRRIALAQVQCDAETAACLAEMKGLIEHAIMAVQSMPQMAKDAELMLRRGEGDPEELKRRIAQCESLDGSVLSGLRQYQDEMRRATPLLLGRTSTRPEDLARKQKSLERIKALRAEVGAFAGEKNLAGILDGDAGEGLAAALLTGILGDLATGNAAEEEERALAGAAASLDLDAAMSDIAAAGSFDMLGAEDARDAFQADKDRVGNLLSSIIARSPDARLLADAKNALHTLDTIAGDAYLRTFESITVSALQKRLREAEKAHAALLADHRKECVRYAALCSFSQTAPVEFPATEEGVASMRKAIRDMESELVLQEEQRHISEAMDDVMADMGYDLIGHREAAKKSGRPFRNKLYAFGEGTALSVTYSPDGQITMELGGIDTSDRVPSAQESSALQEDMEAFCGDFAAIEEKLRQKDVHMETRVSLAPVAAEHAKIININDYVLDTGKQIPRIGTGKKRRRPTAKKALRRVDE